MIDLNQLDYAEFEALVGLILKREGYEITRGPGGPGSHGPDFEVLDGAKKIIVVEVKHFIRQPLGRAMIKQFADDMHRYRQQLPNAKGLLVVSGGISAESLAEISHKFDLLIWDGPFVLELVGKHQDLERIFQEMIDAKGSFQSQVRKVYESPKSRAKELIQALQNVPCGQDRWKDFERICTEILTYTFSPDLAAPDIQSRSDDGLDIVDAIFPVRSYQPPWSIVRSEYHTRFVVAEYKNYCEPIGQSQVESIAQYLWKPAHRCFGILVSRCSPSGSAVAQRRRVWLEQGKCIVLLSDDDLMEMVQLREAAQQPFDIIDAHLEDFLRGLRP